MTTTRPGQPLSMTEAVLAAAAATTPAELHAATMAALRTRRVGSTWPRPDETATLVAGDGAAGKVLLGGHDPAVSYPDGVGVVQRVSLRLSRIRVRLENHLTPTTGDPTETPSVLPPVTGWPVLPDPTPQHADAGAVTVRTAWTLTALAVAALAVPVVSGADAGIGGQHLLAALLLTPAARPLLRWADQGGGPR